MYLEGTALTPGTAVLRRLVEQLASAAVFVEGEHLFLNAATEAMTGYRTADVPTLADWFSRLFSSQGETLRAEYERCRESGFEETERLWLVREDGEERLIEFSAAREGSGEIWLLRDVTEAERLARLMEQATRASRIGGWELECRTNRLFWTAETYRIHEVDPSAFVPDVTAAIAFCTPESRRLLVEAVSRTIEHGASYVLELELTTANGRRIWVESRGVAVREGGKTVRVCGSIQDISDRKRAEEALRRSEEHKRQLVAASPDCVLEIALDGQILSINERGLELLGQRSAKAILGLAWLDGWPGDSHALAERTTRDAVRGEPGRFQALGLGPPFSAAPRWWDVQLVTLLDAAGRPDRLLADARDIHALKQAEAERQRFDRNLLETQKLESLGVLAGGIAHDFNNLLTGVLGNVDLVRLEGPVSGSVAGYLDQIEDVSLRAADLCRQMLAYAGKGRFVVGPVDLGSLIRETVRLLRVTIHKKATLNVRLSDTLPLIHGDATQLGQVVMNLVINASEALPGGEGLIDVTASVQHVGRAILAASRVSADLVPGEYVCVEVADTGSGMDEETLRRIFEPFYTTKFTGRGLGLSAVLGIVRTHGGLLTCASEPGQGTTFRVYFPPSGRTAAPAGLRGCDPEWRGSGKVLVVDDEESVRRTAANLCSSLGFVVIEAPDGVEALRQTETHPDVRLVLLDWTMPRLDGEQTLKRLRPLRPALPVVVMSGYGQSELWDHFAGLGVSGFLKKPFSLDALRQRLSEALPEEAAVRRQ